MLKRAFDIIFSFMGIILLFPIFIIVGIIIKIDSKGPIFFSQERIGKNFKAFRILKFRTMVYDNKGPLLTARGDQRITQVGKYLRRYKIDELPQLLNVFKGDMSLVGPRPEVRKYVELFKPYYKEILTYCPGITDPASLKYSDEEAILSQSQDYEELYIGRILPDKIKLSLEYIKNQNIITDIFIIFKTILRIKTSKNLYEHHNCKKLSGN